MILAPPPACVCVIYVTSPIRRAREFPDFRGRTRQGTRTRFSKSPMRKLSALCVPARDQYGLRARRSFVCRFYNPNRVVSRSSASRKMYFHSFPDFVVKTECPLGAKEQFHFPSFVLNFYFLVATFCFLTELMCFRSITY